MHFGLMLMFAKVTGHFVTKSFRTQVIKHLFGHFVPTNYPFRTHVMGTTEAYQWWPSRLCALNDAFTKNLVCI